VSLRIILTSDLHLGMKFAGYPAAQQALVEARFLCLERIVAAGNQERAELLVVAGDLFESVTTARRDVQRAARALGAFRGKLVAVLPGNHDFIAPEDRLWTSFREASGDTVLLLDEPRPYPLSHYDIDACLYPGPCTAKHSDVNAIGWVKTTGRDSGVRHHIGVAHGSLEGFSPDWDGLYFPMRPAELRESGVGPWLLGHTHVQFPSTPGPRDRIFCAGTPEPDGWDCTHEGSVLSLTVQEDGAVGARAIPTGQFRFVDERREVKAQGDLEQVARRFTGPEAAAILLRLRLFGRAPQEVIASIGALRERMTTTLRHLDLRSDELRGELTAEDIDREYPGGSFPHSLLSSLAREGDLEGLDIAHELLQELRS
jgi:exonuclease SbcD